MPTKKIVTHIIVDISKAGTASRACILKSKPINFRTGYTLIKKAITSIKIDVLAIALPPLLMSSIMCVFVYLIGKIISVDAICLTVQVITGGILYLVLSIVTKNDSFIYMKNIFANKLRRK